MKKIVILQTHPIQYYVPIYRELGARANVDVTVIYLSDSGAREYYDPGFNCMVKWDIDLMSGYRSEVMQPGREVSGVGFFGRYNSKLLGMLKAEKPDFLLLYGYSSLMNWVAWCYAKWAGVNLLYMSDSNLKTEPPHGYLKSMIKRVCVGAFFSGVYRFLYPGEANAQYLLKYGAQKCRLVYSPFAIDVKRFTPRDPGKNRVYDFIWIGKFVELKRAQDYLQALETLRISGFVYRALLVGDGPCKSELYKLAEKLIQYGSLEMLGFANQSEVPALLAASSTLVFTSEKESYGLMATEAAASGCALVVADTIGCVGSSSSAQPGVNALSYKVADLGELTACMRKCLEDNDLLGSMQSESVRIAKAHDVSKAAEVIATVLIGTRVENA